MLPRNALLLPLLATLSGCHVPVRRPAIASDPSLATWEVLAVPTRQSLRGLAVVDAQTIWVGGAAGTLLRTVDGGASWTDVAPPDSTSCDFRDVEAIDAHCALAMVAGQPARVYRTIDGGRSWRVVVEDPQPTAFLDAMAFAGDRGVLVGDPQAAVFAVWCTEDAGRTWIPVAAARLPEALAGEAEFAASGSCATMGAGPEGIAPAFVTGGVATRFVARAAERAWRALPLPLASGTAARGAFSVAFAAGGSGARHGVVVGGDHERPREATGTAAFTDDGGRSWQPATRGPDGYRSSVAWLDGDTVVAVGSHGASVSRDRGRTWQSFGDRGFHALAIGRDGSVFACGADGSVARLHAPRGAAAGATAPPHANRQAGL